MALRIVKLLFRNRGSEAKFVKRIFENERESQRNEKFAAWKFWMRFVRIQCSSSSFWNDRTRSWLQWSRKEQILQFFEYRDFSKSQGYILKLIILIIFCQALIIDRQNGTYPWESIVTELFLVCDQASKVQTLFIIGIFAEIFSILSEFFNFTELRHILELNKTHLKLTRLFLVVNLTA